MPRVRSRRPAAPAMITTALALFISGATAFTSLYSMERAAVALRSTRTEEPAFAFRQHTLSDSSKRVYKADYVKDEDGSLSFDPTQLSTTIDGATSLSDDNDDDKSELGIWTARGLLIAVAAIWGTNFASVKYLATLCFHPPCNHPPSEAAFARFGVAGLVSLPLLWQRRHDWDVIMAGLECGVWITLGYVCQALALATISSGKCAFICSLTVVTVPIIAALFYGKPIKTMNLIAAAVALSGVAVLEGMVDVTHLLGVAPALAETATYTATTSTAALPEAITSSSMETASAATAAAVGPLATIAKMLHVSQGDVLALGQPVGFGFSFTRIEYYQEKYKHIEGRTTTNAAAQCVMVGLLSLIWVLSDYHWQLPNMEYLLEPHRMAAILWTGIVTTVFAIFLQATALQKATATDAAITFSTEPVWASLFALALLGEQLTTNLYVGGAIVLLACLVGALSDIDIGAEDLAMVKTEPTVKRIGGFSTENISSHRQRRLSI